MFIVEGNSISILTAERLVLNYTYASHATKTSYLNSLISRTNCKLIDTRKTTPPKSKTRKNGKVKIGGGINHRFGLFDMIMIKDNHIDFAGGVDMAIQKTKKYLKRKIKI